VKLFISGWRGPWGYIGDLEYYIEAVCQRKIEIVYQASHADIIFQADKTNWKDLLCLNLSGKKLVVNTLDFNNWSDNQADTSDTLEYVDLLARKANLSTAISEDVIMRLKNLGIDAKMFYYPSQIKSVDHFAGCRMHRKEKTILSIGRLSDRGKNIKVAVDCFLSSMLPQVGYKYILIGPELPPFGTAKSNSVKYIGYAGRDLLIELIRNSTIVVQASKGEGLGLPAIEASLLGTAFLARNTPPMSQIWKEVPDFLFKTDEDLSYYMEKVASSYEKAYISYDLYVDKAKTIALPWLRENAFDSFIKMVNEVVQS
jgi:hypothetical protein